MHLHIHIFILYHAPARLYAIGLFSHQAQTYNTKKHVLYNIAAAKHICCKSIDVSLHSI